MYPHEFIVVKNYSPLRNVAVCFLHLVGVGVALTQALKPEFKEYQQQVVANAQAMCKALQARGYTVVSGNKKAFQQDAHPPLANRTCFSSNQM